MQGVFGVAPIVVGDEPELAAQRGPLTDAARGSELPDGVERGHREQPEHVGTIPFADDAVDDMSQHLAGHRPTQPLDGATRPGDSRPLQLVADGTSIGGGRADDGDIVGRDTGIDQPSALADDLAHLLVGVGARDHFGCRRR